LTLPGRMHINPFTLHFSDTDKKLEAGFRKYFFKLSLPVFRWGFLLGIVLYGLFAFLDAMFMPELKHQFWLIRFALVIPVMAAGILFSFHENFEKYWQPSISFIITIAAFGIFWMIAMSSAPEGNSYYVGNILVLFFCFTFIRARFIWATFTGLLILLMFEITSIWLTDTPFIILLRNNFFFISAIIVGMVACYSMEYFARGNFFLMVSLEEEKKKLSNANEKLQHHIKELEQAHREIKTLSGLIPICANCKKIRDDRGYWNQIEKYISEHSEAVFSHALCPECIEKLYGHEEWFQNK